GIEAGIVRVRHRAVGVVEGDVRGLGGSEVECDVVGQRGRERQVDNVRVQDRADVPRHHKDDVLPLEVRVGDRLDGRWEVPRIGDAEVDRVLELALAPGGALRFHIDLGQVIPRAGDGAERDQGGRRGDDVLATGVQDDRGRVARVDDRQADQGRVARV